MANFATHIGFGTVVSGALATVTVASGAVSPDDLVAVTLAGVLGSILPDIDLDESRPSRIMFSGFAIFASFAALFTVAAKYSIAEMLIVWLGTLAAVRYGLHGIFHFFAVHRGVWHSILGAVFSSVATAIVFTSLLGRPGDVAWLAAGFLFMGYLTHLILDEAYSVDVMNRHIKTSFGTALKLIDGRHPRQTAAMALALVLALFAAPSIKEFAAEISSRDLWAGLQGRLLPRDKWFGVAELAPSDPAAASASSAALMTGALPEHPAAGEGARSK